MHLTLSFAPCNYRCCRSQRVSQSLFVPCSALLRYMGKRLSLTFANPMSEDFSLKHWRQMFNPYLRMRPAGWVQIRLWCARCQHLLFKSTPLLQGFGTATSLGSRLKRRAECVEEVERNRGERNHTTSELPSHIREVLSTRRIREP